MTEYYHLSAERDLRDFLARHPELLERGLTLVRDEVEYDTGKVGRIDLLCRDEEGRHVVVEIKKQRDSDKVVGQISRYMGWVREHLAGGGVVRGIIVTHEFDERLDYAARANDNIEVRYYAVRFELSDEPFEI